MNSTKHVVFVIFYLLVNYSFACQWVQMASFGGQARHRCTGFAVGNKGYIGGGHINSGIAVYHEDYWQYDPGSDTWTQIADFGGGKRYHSTAFSIGEFGYVGLGEDDQNNYLNDFYRYVPEFNIWQPIQDFPGNPRRGAAGFAIDGFGYVGTGQSDFGYEVDFYKYDPITNNWVSRTDFPGEARSSAVAFSYDGKGYLGTGHIWGDDTSDFYMYDPVTNSWTEKAMVGNIDRQDATGFVVNGKGYIGTGNDVDGNHNYKDFWQYDFENDTWTQVEDFCGEGRRYMVSFVINGVAYAGTGTDGTNLKDFWKFDPTLETPQNGSEKISLYPNPSTDKVVIKGGDDLTISIYTAQGQLLLRRKINSSTSIIHKNELGAGAYIYQLSSDQNRDVKNGKIIFY